MSPEDTSDNTGKKKHKNNKNRKKFGSNKKRLAGNDQNDHKPETSSETSGVDQATGSEEPTGAVSREKPVSIDSHEAVDISEAGITKETGEKLLKNTDTDLATVTKREDSDVVLPTHFSNEPVDPGKSPIQHTQSTTNYLIVKKNVSIEVTMSEPSLNNAIGSSSVTQATLTHTTSPSESSTDSSSSQLTSPVSPIVGVRPDPFHYDPPHQAIEQPIQKYNNTKRMVAELNIPGISYDNEGVRISPHAPAWVHGRIARTVQIMVDNFKKGDTSSPINIEKELALEKLEKAYFGKDRWERLFGVHGHPDVILSSALDVTNGGVGNKVLKHTQANLGDGKFEQVKYKNISGDKTEHRVYSATTGVHTQDMIAQPSTMQRSATDMAHGFATESTNPFYAPVFQPMHRDSTEMRVVPLSAPLTKNPPGLFSNDTIGTKTQPICSKDQGSTFSRRGSGSNFFKSSRSSSRLSVTTDTAATTTTNHQQPFKASRQTSQGSPQPDENKNKKSTGWVRKEKSRKMLAQEDENKKQGDEDNKDAQKKDYQKKGSKKRGKQIEMN